MKDREDSLLFNIKVLDKLIVREFLKTNDNIVPPTPSQMVIMEYIIKHPNIEVYQKDLEDILKLRRATVSGVLQTMEKNDLIKRVTTEADARVKRIILNESAKQIYLACVEQISKLEMIARQGLSKEEIKTFKSLINKIQSNIIEYSQKERE